MLSALFLFSLGSSFSFQNDSFKLELSFTGSLSIFSCKGGALESSVRLVYIGLHREVGDRLPSSLEEDSQDVCVDIYFFAPFFQHSLWELYTWPLMS